MNPVWKTVKAASEKKIEITDYSLDAKKTGSQSEGDQQVFLGEDTDQLRDVITIKHVAKNDT